MPDGRDGILAACDTATFLIGLVIGTAYWVIWVTAPTKDDRALAQYVWGTLSARRNYVHDNDGK